MYNGVYLFFMQRNVGRRAIPLGRSLHYLIMRNL